MIRRRTYPYEQKCRGTEAVDRMSETAQRYFYGTSPLHVYAIETPQGVRYDTDGCVEAEGLSFEELERLFTRLQEDLDSLYGWRT